MTVQFDNQGFAIESGFMTVHVIDAQGVYVHSEEQYISEGGSLSANAVLSEPKAARQGFAVQWTGKVWQYVEDHRGEVYYNTQTKAEVTISELGKIPENLTALQPSDPNCEWNGEVWVLRAEKQAELKAQKLQQFIDGVDNKASRIYSIWTRFEIEYAQREAAAVAFKAANYQGEVSRFIADFATKAGIDNVTATNLILVQAEGLRKLLVELANQRMRKYELKKPNLTEDEMQTIYDDIIQQMDNLAEAYNNG
ncbi:hypothetical protein [[Mannheimia] succiniciproducens]|uniref:Tail fiber assembly protein n=1 Tax=Mannheimia succiniciproducens (strain KCTC 0769BP / MBEL55E) TaxID=221988 RepID=Q65WH5_MANSM|nr:hypothetical protein [[Mannheimia] succiniciproducens]AAU36685.1 unknown [[Mannheimia] succiniciproducens MBEL55E]